MQKPHQYRKLFIIGAIFTCLFFAIIFYIRHQIISSNTFHIDNFTSYFNNVPSDQRQNIESVLKNTVLYNNSDTQVINTSSAIIRQDTATNEYDASNNSYYGTFIVDIENLQLSFFVQFEWTKEKDNSNLSSTSAVVSCVNDTLKLYDTPCRDYISQKDDHIEKLPLPYTSSLTSGRRYTVDSSYYEDGTEYLKISVYTCQNQEIVSEVQSSVNTWLQTYNFTLDDITYLIFDTCNQ